MIPKLVLSSEILNSEFIFFQYRLYLSYKIYLLLKKFVELKNVFRYITGYVFD